MRRFARALLMTFFFLPLTAAVAGDVPYVPTPENVVEEMLRMANVGRDDLLYDLGCGDGRIVVTAAKRMGARGVGVDIDPERIRESRENARRAGVTQQVQFMEMDLFQVDFSQATVVTLYLLPDVNLRLRPKLLRELKPGTRLVSHDFDMRDWEADETTEVNSHTIYFWTIPANAGGTWIWTARGPQGEETYRMELRQKFQQAEGQLTVGDASFPMRHVRIHGDRLQFSIERGVNGGKDTMRFEGRIADDRLQGTMKSGTDERPWQATREPQTMQPIDGEVRL